MAWTVPEDYQAFEKHWKHLGFSDWPGRQPANLTNPINPTFKKKLKGCQLFWGTDREYEMIKPALRLASAFLTTPASMLFIYSLVYECKRLPSQFDTMLASNSQVRRTKERDPKIILPRMCRIFKEAAVHNWWGPNYEYYEHGDHKGHSHVVDFDEVSEEQGPRLRSDRRIGCCTYISFNGTFVKWIERLHAEGKQDSLQMLATQFHLAVVLCHESIHMIHMANNWQLRLWLLADYKNNIKSRCWRTREPYWEDDGDAELGWAWTNEVFGSAIRDDNLEDFDRPMIGWVQEWPERSTLQFEALRNGPDWPYVAAGLMPTGLMENDGLEENYFISMQYIHAVQQQSNWELFGDQWDQVKKNFDTELNIRIPKGIGFLGEWGEGKWVNLIKDEIRYRHPIPRAICSAEHSEDATLERKESSLAAPPMQAET